MDTGKAILADIIANPEDDTPRLVYADWLEENGKETRAEFIRVQLALAKKRLPAGPTPRRDPVQMEKATFGGNGNNWAVSYGDWCDPDLEAWRRGFPVEASLINRWKYGPPDWGRQIAEFREARSAAPIERLTLKLPKKDDPGMREFLSLPGLERM